MIVETVTVCDEIRQEITGKYLLIGVYTGFVGVEQFPSNLNVSFFITTKPQQIGEAAFEFRVLAPTGIELARVQGSIQITHPGLPGTLPLPPIGFQVQMPGYVQLQQLTSPGGWETIKSILVSSPQLTGPTQSGPPIIH